MVMVGKSLVIETLKLSRNFWRKIIYSLGKRKGGGGKKRRNEEEEKKERNRHREQVGAKTAQGKN